MAEPTEKTRGEIACDAFAAHLISVPLGGVICGGGISTAWSQYSELGKAAWEAAADVIRAEAIEECADPFHKEQVQIWAQELIADLGAAGHLAEVEDYEQVLSLHRVVEQFLDETVAARVRDLKSQEKPV